MGGQLSGGGGALVWWPMVGDDAKAAGGELRESQVPRAVLVAVLVMFNCARPWRFGALARAGQQFLSWRTGRLPAPSLSLA